MKRKLKRLKTTNNKQKRHCQSHFNEYTLNGFHIKFVDFIAFAFGLICSSSECVLAANRTQSAFFKQTNIHNSFWVCASVWMVIWIVNLLTFSLWAMDKANVNTVDTIAINRTPKIGDKNCVRYIVWYQKQQQKDKRKDFARYMCVCVVEVSTTTATTIACIHI